MSWSYPVMFWGFLILPVVIGAAWMAWRSARIHLSGMGGTGVEWQVRMFLRTVSMVAFTILIVLAAAEPRSGRRPLSGERSGLDVAVAFDVSRSMLSTDLEPDRLSRATAALRQISGGLESARFSLVPFKGDAILSVPMTEDRSVLDVWIDRLGPGLSSVPGTNLEEALRTARWSFPEGTGRKRVIILISDGESLTGSSRKVVRDLLDEGIPVFVLAAGTSQGGTIPLADGSYVLDESGHPVITRADFKDLQTLAEDTGGTFYSMERPGAVTELIAEVNRARVFAETRGIRFVGVHRYRLFLLPAAVLVLVYLFVRIIPWRRR